ncbi:MAG: hypothetical protein E4G98_01130 [Promethearchaeota archaeon]|nr:MAG: hypothetical protein E4G98_01130 [Candidatus Lokiarchaeota archaeon]
MSVVKIYNKNRLDKLVAKITLRLGRKPTQQEVVDLCIIMGENHFETLISHLHPVPIFDEEKLKKIQNVSKELEDVPWDLEEDKQKKLLNDSDVDIYLV